MGALNCRRGDTEAEKVLDQPTGWQVLPEAGGHRWLGVGVGLLSADSHVADPGQESGDKGPGTGLTGFFSMPRFLCESRTLMTPRADCKSQVWGPRITLHLE